MWSGRRAPSRLTPDPENRAEHIHVLVLGGFFQHLWPWPSHDPLRGTLPCRTVKILADGLRVLLLAASVVWGRPGDTHSPAFFFFFFIHYSCLKVKNHQRATIYHLLPFLRETNKSASQNWPVIKQKEWFVWNELALLRNAISPESAFLASRLHACFLKNSKVLWPLTREMVQEVHVMSSGLGHYCWTWKLQAWHETWNNRRGRNYHVTTVTLMVTLHVTLLMASLRKLHSSTGEGG